LIGLVVAVGAVAGGALFWQRSHAKPPQETAAPPVPPPAAQATPALPAPLVIPAPAAVDLEHSDGVFRDKAKALSNLPKLAEWLRTDDLVRRLTASVDCIADGTSPRESLSFMAPKKKFTANKVKGQAYLDPRSYSRYDMVADVVGSIDAQAAAAFVKTLDPYLQLAAREMGTPPRDFQATLVKAIKGLLQTPVVERKIALQEKVVSYAILPMPDLKLEDLTAAQKHLLRMGPKNTTKIQSKLRDLALALGVPADQIPQQKIYTAK
jgi:hypothetical protein